MKKTLIGIDKLKKDLLICGWGETERESIIKALLKAKNIELVTEEQITERFWKG